MRSYAAGRSNPHPPIRTSPEIAPPVATPSNADAKARDAADAELNAVYKLVRGNLDGANGQRLVAAQRLWIQYRDANCAAERDLYEGGTAAFPAYLACLEAMTRARTKELAVTYAVKLK